LIAAPRVALVGRYELAYPDTEQQLDYPVLRALAERSGRLDIVAQARDGIVRTWSEGPLRVHYGPRRAGPLRNLAFVAWAVRRVWRLRRDEGLDVVNGSDLLGGIVGLVLRPVTRVPVVIQLQGQFLDPSPHTVGPLRGRLTAMLARWLARRGDAVRCLYSRSAELATRAGVNADRLVVVPSRCDPALFDPTRHDGAPVRGRLLFVGNLIDGKGVQYLLDAVARVAKTHPHVSLVVAGSGPYDAALRARAERLGVAERVEFVGRVPHASLPAALAACEVFVFPSLSEATPRAVMEAMSMARPVVASAVGGIPDLVEDGVHGRLVPPADAERLADAIRAVLDAPEDSRAAGRRARQRVLDRFTVAHHVDAMARLHRRAAERAPSSVSHSVSASAQ
jgi:glycosyltransferase involved in cell wall biosynthesis